MPAKLSSGGVSAQMLWVAAVSTRNRRRLPRPVDPGVCCDDATGPSYGLLER
jgi:hypothetical protein